MLKLYYFGCQLSKAKKQFILQLRQINKMGNASSWCNYGRPQSKDKDDFEAVQNEVLIGGEPLGEVNGEQMKKRLHKHQAVIICRYKNLKLWGSGVSISKDLVLTSAHNFFIGDELMDKVDYFIYPGHAGSLKKAFKIDKFYVNDQYKNAQGKETIKFDYALIKLTEKLDTTADFIRLKVLTDYDTKTQLGVFGYPQKEYKSEISEEKYYVNQWGKRKVNAIVDVRRQNGEIRHSVSTLPGQSGSPIIEINKQQVNIVGIHKGGIRYKLNGKSQWSNVGRLITKELVDQLKQKAKQMGAQMFKIWSRDSKSQMNLSVLPFYPAQYASPPKISSQDKKKALLLFRAGQDLYFKNDYPKANAKFIDSITLNPKSAAVCFHLGLTYDHTQHYDVAIEWYKKAKEIDPGNASYLKVLASALQKNEQYGPAADIYRQILSKNQHDQPALMSLAHALYKSNNIVQAISIYKKITESNPWYFQAHYGLGCANMAVKQYSLALKSFEKCAQIKSNDQKTKKKMGQIQAKLKQNEQI